MEHRTRQAIRWWMNWFTIWIIMGKGTYCTAAGDRICNPGRDTKKAKDAQVTVASWFMIKSELCSDTDLHLRDEEDYIRLVENMEYDVIYADPCMKRMTPEFDGIFVDTIHFAVSGHLAEMR